MTAYEWSETHKEFVKECPTCHTAYKGGIEPHNANDKLSTFFNYHPKTRDGFNSQCRSCQNDRRHKRWRSDKFTVWEFQNKKCAICDTQIKFQGNSSVMDHCHKTNKNRGVLCNSCNVLMSGIDNED